MKNVDVNTFQMLCTYSAFFLTILLRNLTCLFVALCYLTFL